jgi:nicotine blue oxidoreductase
MTEFVGLVLAAGEGKRFGGPKAPFELNGERLVDRAVRILHEAGAVHIYVVLGAWIGDVENADVIVNPDWETGMASSLRVGLSHLETQTNSQRAVITLVDLPGLTAQAIERVASDSHSISVATYDGTRGHPVAFNREHWEDVANSAHGDSGAREFLKAHMATTNNVEVGDIATGEDMDVRP